MTISFQFVDYDDICKRRHCFVLGEHTVKKTGNLCGNWEYFGNS